MGLNQALPNEDVVAANIADAKARASEAFPEQEQQQKTELPWWTRAWNAVKEGLSRVGSFIKWLCCCAGCFKADAKEATPPQASASAATTTSATVASNTAASAASATAGVASGQQQEVVPAVSGSLASISATAGTATVTATAPAANEAGVEGRSRAASRASGDATAAAFAPADDASGVGPDSTPRAVMGMGAR